VYFDAAILITTFTDEKFISRKCRHIENHLYLADGTVEVVKSFRDEEDSKRGCFNAHFNIYRLMVERGYKNCIIFEDDVHFVRKIQEAEYAEFLDTHDWDVFYFGHKPDHRQKTFAWSTIRSHIVKVKTNDRHAYAMSQKCAQVMAKMPWSGIFGDRLLRSTTKEAYALYPMGAIQSGPLFTDSFYNGITEKFNEYYGLINQRPFQLFRTVKFALRFLVIMPYAFVRSVVLAIGINRDYPND
jgi:hypothetical protein